jgi:hypothetical protein
VRSCRSSLAQYSRINSAVPVTILKLRRSGEGISTKIVSSLETYVGRLISATDPVTYEDITLVPACHTAKSQQRINTIESSEVKLSSTKH